MPRVNFIFALHFHQPLGQLKGVNEKIFVNSYRLLLDVFKSFADLKFTVHVSGPLLLYLAKNHPEWLEELFKLGDLGVLEFMAGSLGEAILPIIPREDREAQIREYIALFERLSGFKPKGLWLPERVWEPGLPEVLGKLGVEYVFIDDSTLTKTGHPQDLAYYAWNTEDSGQLVRVFFIDAGIRYILPWEPPERVLEYLVSKGREGDQARLVLWGSDAEKFGEWMDPERSRSWLYSFLELMRRSRDRVSMTHPSEYLMEHGVRGLLYFDTGSYDKMLEWSRGFFRNFLVKYRESNNMHKKMLWVRRKLGSLDSVPEEVRTGYLLSQCNDAYWHGLFGGIYLAHLRQAIYEELIRTEAWAERETGYFRDTGVRVGMVDFDYDGEPEVLVETPSQNLYVKPDDGGTLFEYDVKSRGLEHNLQDTMSRYGEPYINKPGFHPDWYRRVSWRIHLWSDDTGLYDWINNTPFKDMSDLALKKHHVAVGEGNEITLRALGGFYQYGSTPVTVMVEKKINLTDKGHAVTYRIRNMGDKTFSTRLGIEYHVAWKIDRENDEKPYYVVEGVSRDVSESGVFHTERITVGSAGYPSIVLEASKPHEAWIAQLASLSRTEKGFKEMPQGLGVMFTRQLVLKPGEEYEASVSWMLKA
ncbi:alpha-amylase/4-alpha-glucanotransferase domain-containing protein [Desulfurococcus mucosus]|uniref:Alpha-amylase n=1 Tax=Desulfurococcus mucosus (strain ATCC 35584 / DSM 2162 / JCM 9187 / O7/1) TaxID=765177 RepID=E8R986_DESM0|nr:alpha-amylase/4-alpha-glucanotransferase domain-containing protein [Desulfurococcus mucosus]ADV65062.1 alpha-amylase [Desulfurococcus mucosus DSM 2162]